MKTFELFIQNNKVNRTDWLSLENQIWKYDKQFVIQLNLDTHVEFYISAGKDLSLLATQLEGFLLQPTEKRIQNNFALRKIHFKLPLNKNVLEVKEIEEIKKGRRLVKIIIECNKVLGVHWYRVTVYFKLTNGHECYSNYTSLVNPLISFEFDFKRNSNLKKKSTPIFLKIDDIATQFSPNKQGGFLEVFGFPHFSSPVYFPLENFEFNKHTLVVGQTGVGKSKFIELFVKQIAQRGLMDDYRVVIIDPHANLFPQFESLKSKAEIDFLTTICNLFPASSEPKIATELTILLFKTLLQDQFNAKLERVLKYVIYTLLLNNSMSLRDLKKFLTELTYRKEVINAIADRYDYLAHFFETEFVELQTKFYDNAVMPILVLIDELNFIPAFSQESTVSLESILQKNFLTCFSLNRIYLGEKATRLLAGLIIQQLFLIAQRKSINKKIILIIDEVSIVENESLASILSEARKFNLSLFLAQQYLTQISPPLLQAVLSNVYNYFVFKVADSDAKLLAKNLQMKFPDEILTKEREKGLSEEDLKRDLLVNLNPRETLVRIYSQLKFYPCFKSKTMEV